MRDLILRGRSAAPAFAPKGIAFAIADLVLASSWAMSRDCHMTVGLNHGDTFEEYEEVIEFRSGRNAAAHLLLWRSTKAVFVQPLPGKTQRHGSVAEALENLHPTPRVNVTNIVATVWPD